MSTLMIFTNNTIQPLLTPPNIGQTFTVNNVGQCAIPGGTIQVNGRRTSDKSSIINNGNATIYLNTEGVTWRANDTVQVTGPQDGHLLWRDSDGLEVRTPFSSDGETKGGDADDQADQKSGY